jgi:hypothetical protein
VGPQYQSEDTCDGSQRSGQSSRVKELMSGHSPTLSGFNILEIPRTRILVELTCRSPETLKRERCVVYALGHSLMSLDKKGLVGKESTPRCVFVQNREEHRKGGTHANFLKTCARGQRDLWIQSKGSNRSPKSHFDSEEDRSGD